MRHNGFSALVAIFLLSGLEITSQLKTDEVDKLRIIQRRFGQIRVIWFSPPKVDHGYYQIKIEETGNNNSQPKVEYSSRKGFIFVEFDDLKEFTNYTITVNDFQHGVYVPIATEFFRTFIEDPHPVLSANSKAESIVIKFRRKEGERPGDFDYRVIGYEHNSSVRSRLIKCSCNQSTNECVFDYLRPNTFYEFKIHKCATARTGLKKETLCSFPLGPSRAFCTLPQSPTKPRNITTNSNSIRIFYNRDTSLKTAKYLAVANPVRRNRTNSVEVECENEHEVCHFDGLPANTAYEVRIQVCTDDFKRFRCSDWSPPATIYTDPDKPRDVVTSSYAANSITVFWKPPLSNTEPISFYEITAVDTQDEKKIVKVFNQATNGTINNLKSFEQYQVHVSACVRGKYCGASAIISAITAPEAPEFVQQKTRNADRIVIAYSPITKVQNANYTAMIYINDTKKINVRQVECNASISLCYFDKLLPNGSYLIRLRVCSNDFNTTICSDWSTPMIIFTKPDSSQIRITAIVLSFLVLLLAILIAVAIGFCQRILRIVRQVRYWQEKIYALELR